MMMMMMLLLLLYCECSGPDPNPGSAAPPRELVPNGIQSLGGQALPKAELLAND